MMNPAHKGANHTYGISYMELFHTRSVLPALVKKRVKCVIQSRREVMRHRKSAVFLLRFIQYKTIYEIPNNEIIIRIL